MTEHKCLLTLFLLCTTRIYPPLIPSLLYTSYPTPMGEYRVYSSCLCLWPLDPLLPHYQSHVLCFGFHPYFLTLLWLLEMRQYQLVDLHYSFYLEDWFIVGLFPSHVSALDQWRTKTGNTTVKGQKNSWNFSSEAWISLFFQFHFTSWLDLEVCCQFLYRPQSESWRLKDLVYTKWVYRGGVWEDFSVKKLVTVAKLVTTLS